MQVTQEYSARQLGMSEVISLHRAAPATISIAKLGANVTLVGCVAESPSGRASPAEGPDAWIILDSTGTTDVVDFALDPNLRWVAVLVNSIVESEAPRTGVKFSIVTSQPLGTHQRKSSLSGTTVAPTPVNALTGGFSAIKTSDLAPSTYESTKILFADTKTLTFFWWMRHQGAATRLAQNPSTGSKIISIQGSGSGLTGITFDFPTRGFRFFFDAVTLVSNFDMTTDPLVPLQADVWTAVMCSWDSLNGLSACYFQQLDQPAVDAQDTVDNQDNDFADIDAPGQHEAYGTQQNNGIRMEICQMLMADAYIDLDVAANREMFVTAAGRPKDLGALGEIPLGQTPEVYWPDGDPRALDSFTLWDDSPGAIAFDEPSLIGPATRTANR